MKQIITVLLFILLGINWLFAQQKDAIELNFGLAYSDFLPAYFYQEDGVFPVLNVNILYDKVLTKNISIFSGLRYQPQKARYRLFARNSAGNLKTAIYNLRLTYLTIPLGGELKLSLGKKKKLFCSINGGFYASYLLSRKWKITFIEEPATDKQRGRINSNFNFGYLFGASFQYSINPSTKIILRGEFNKSLQEVRVGGFSLQIYQFPTSIPITVGISKTIESIKKQ